MYRPTDPVTSSLAAEAQVRSGKLSERRLQVLHLVAAYPDRTHGELARIMLETHPALGILCCAETPHKRLPELKDLGLVAVTGVRECRETHNLARTWRLTMRGVHCIDDPASIDTHWSATGG